MRKALEDRYIIAIQKIHETGLFTYAEIGKIFNLHRNTVIRYTRFDNKKRS